MQKMLSIVVHENTELGDNTPEWWKSLTCKHKISNKIKRINCNPYKTTVNLENLKIKKKICQAVSKLFAYLFK